MFLFASCAEAGTHYAAFIVTALSHAHAAQRGVRQAAMILGKLKVSPRFPRFVVGAQTQVLIQLIRLNYLARIHFPIWIPQGFELTESLDQFRAKHFRQQFGTRLPVAVFAGERAAITDDQISGFFYKLAVVGDAGFGLQIEIDSHVYTGVSEMSVEGTAVAVAR